MGNYTYTDGSFEATPRLPDAYAEAPMTGHERPQRRRGTRKRGAR